MRAPNRAIQRTRHVTPTFEEVISDLGKSRVFPKLDLSNAYHQLELDEESRSITTFSTHLGLKRYKRLNFGINCASEIFQEAIRQVIQDIPNVINISDDILVHTADMASHEETIHRVFQRLTDRGLTLNRAKCQLFKSSLNYLGHRTTNEGISPDPEQVKAVKEAPRPTNVAGVRSFMGLVTYCVRFIPKLADISKPLRDLTTKDAAWVWTDQHENAFRNMQDALTSEQVLVYYNSKRQTKILVDGSPIGVAAILTQQQGHKTYIVAYASRALTPVEQPVGAGRVGNSLWL